MCDMSRVIGFLFGFSLASSYAAYQLLDEYKQASAALQASVEELQRSTEKVCINPLSQSPQMMTGTADTRSLHM